MIILLSAVASFVCMKIFFILMYDKINERYSYTKYDFYAVSSREFQIYILKDCFINMCLLHKIIACVTGIIGLPFILINVLLCVVNCKWLIG